MMRVLITIVLLLGLGTVYSAQDTYEDERAIEIRTRSSIYAGPGSTHLPVERLAWQDNITITGRNQAGTWLQVDILRGRETEISGWVQTGHLVFNADLSFADFPVLSLPDGNPETINSQSMSELAAVPLLSDISPAMIDVFERGQELGNQADVITKIGDSVSDSLIFLGAMNVDDYDLGPHADLADTVDFFNTPEDSVASRIGMTTYVIFDPFWADSDTCEANESPLACELRRTQPSVAFVLFGPNDVRAMDDEQFKIQIEMIVQQVLDAGVIPVLITYSIDPDDGLLLQGIQFNLRLAELAEEYEVPLINYWLAAQDLPENGLDEDDVHLTHSGFRNMTYNTGHEAYYGMSLLNLLAARVLDDLRLTLNMDGA